MTDNKVPPGYIPLTHHTLGGGQNGWEGRGRSDNGHNGDSRRSERSGKGPRRNGPPPKGKKHGSKYPHDRRERPAGRQRPGGRRPSMEGLPVDDDEGLDEE